MAALSQPRRRAARAFPLLVAVGVAAVVALVPVGLRKMDSANRSVAHETVTN